MGAAVTLSGALPGAYPGTGLAKFIRLGLLAHAVVAHPLIGLYFGRPLALAEVLGLAPDATSLASLGLLLLIGRSWWRGVLAAVPVAWCVTSATTLLTLGETQGWLLVVSLALWTMACLSQAASERAPD